MADLQTNGAKRAETLVVTSREERPDHLSLALAGRMTANGIGELRRELDEARRQRKQVILDLGEVTLLDRVSAEFLNSVASPTVRFENCPPYLRRWIGRSGSDSEL